MHRHRRRYDEPHAGAEQHAAASPSTTVTVSPNYHGGRSLVPVEHSWTIDLDLVSPVVALRGVT